MKPAYCITLVHGTWASNAPWTRQGSAFREKLGKCLGEEVTFEVPQWKGRNRHIDRKAGGRALASFLEVSGQKAETSKRFLICHSHGGNVALYAMEEGHLEDRVSGIVCMNTPFVCAIPRNFKPLYIALGFLFFFLLITMAEFALGSFLFVEWSIPARVLLWILAIPISIGLTLATFGLWASVSELVNAIGRKRNTIINQVKLPETKIPILSVWTAGDEISSGLGVAGGLSDLPFILLYWPIVALSLFLIALALGIGWLPILEYFQMEPTGWYSSMHAWARAHLFYPMASALIYFFILLFVFVMIALTVNWFLCVVLYGLGARNLFSPLWVRFFSTPIPIGPRSSEFKSVDPETPALSHSIIYQSDAVVAAIADWIKMQAGTEAGGEGA